MNSESIHNFGVVDEQGDAFELVIPQDAASACRFVAVLQTERGPRRTEVAEFPVLVWSEISGAVARELATEMAEGERTKKPPTFRTGANRLSPLVGRELGVLLIALMEEGAAAHVDALLRAWRELAREERWWLYAKAAAPGQRAGVGWRRALFHALSETAESRAVPADEAEKKSSGSTETTPAKRPQTRPTASRKLLDPLHKKDPVLVHAKTIPRKRVSSRPAEDVAKAASRVKTTVN